MSRKSTKVEMEQREEKILELMSQGFSRGQIGERIANEYNCTKKAACKQYDRLIKSLKISSPEEKESARAIFLQRYEYLYQTALGRDQLKNAIDILDRQAKLLGLYTKEVAPEAAPKINIQGRPDLSVVPDKAKNGEEK